MPVVDWLHELYGQPRDPVLQSLENGPSTPALGTLQSFTQGQGQGQDPGNSFHFNPVQPIQNTPVQPLPQTTAPTQTPIQAPSDDKVDIEGAKYSKNNPYLSYVPGPKHLFRKFIGMSDQWKFAAQQWENENAPKQSPLQQQQQKLQTLATRMVLEMMNNPEMMQTHGNKLKFYYSTLSSPGGELMAQPILTDVFGMHNTKPVGITVNPSQYAQGLSLGNPYRNVFGALGDQPVPLADIEKLMNQADDYETKKSSSKSGEEKETTPIWIKQLDKDYADYTKTVKTEERVGKLQWVSQHPQYKDRVREYMHYISGGDEKYFDDSRTTYGLVNREITSTPNLLRADRYLQSVRTGSVRKAIAKAINDRENREVIEGLIERWNMTPGNKKRNLNYWVKEAKKEASGR